jgi:hypothetical protein
MMSSSDKRKHEILTLGTKAKIIKKLDESGKLINLAKEHGVWSATIYDIRKNRGKIECSVKNTGSSPSDRQTLYIELMNKNSQPIFM